MLLFFTTLWLNLALAAPNPTTANMNHFIDHLMKKMTVEEKVGQLTMYSADMAVTGASIRDDYRNEIIKGHVGSIFNAFTPKFTREVQKVAVEQSRLKIPLLLAFDVIHGHRTIFPIPLGESASWDLPLMQKSAEIAAREASADGIQWTFAPMVDIARDPRWGRISEGAGEDPWLGSRIAEVKVRGYQGKEIGALDHILACVKHFAAYGAPVGGRDYNTVNLGPRELSDVYLPPYHAAVAAGVASLMPSFNDIDGIPSTANTMLLRRLLRGAWKFNGIIVSDYTAINELVKHGLALNEEQAAVLALKAGVDVDMQGGSYMKYLPALIKAGKVPRALVDQAVRRVLVAKYKLGLFKDPYRFSDEARAKKELLTPANRAVAREVARHSIVLLKNEKGVLPLKRSGTIALIGPFVKDHRDLIGNWSGAGQGKEAVALDEGMAEVAGDKVKFLYALGANAVDKGPLLTKLNQHGGEIPTDGRSDEDMIDEAVSVARKADVVVLALGETQGMSGEAAARSYLHIPINQENLLQALRARAGKPIVLLLSNGRPLVLERENLAADALVETWFLGSESGHAIADVLFGDYNPSGRLTASFPRSEGQIPVYYAARPTGRPFDDANKYTSKYLDTSNEPLFPFGYGLSYTTFSYSTPRLSSAQLTTKAPLKVRVTVMNSGPREGEETVQLYIHQQVASVTRPAKLLRGFQKVHLKAGESREVEFTLTAEDLKFTNQEMKWVNEPSPVSVLVGGNSRDLKTAEFQLRL